MEINEELNAMQEVAEAAAEEDVELTAEELPQVAGGRHFITGYAPGTPCPDCGAILLDNNKMHDGISFESICPNCKEIWLYQYN